MNTKNLTSYRIPLHHDAWFRFRTTGLTSKDCEEFNCPPYASGIGASEIGTILGLSKNYRPCAAEYYHYKVGDLTPTQNANRAMIRGKILEPVVKSIWCQYDGSDSWVMSMEDYQNGDAKMRDNLSLRKARKINAYMVNNNYPWLFSSLDYFAEKNTMGLIAGENGKPEIFAEGFPIECKTINLNYAKLWNEGVPPYHVAQLNMEMLCTNSNYGEIACLMDDWSFKIFPFYKDQELCDRIIYWSKIFWDKVLIGREAKTKMEKYFQAGNADEGEHMQAIINSNEPEPDDGEGYTEYMREQYTKIFESTPGDMDLFYDCMTDKACLMIDKLLTEIRTGVKNKVLKVLVDSKAEEISFDELGKITYRANKNGTRVLDYGGIKMKPSKEMVENEFNKMNLNFRDRM